MLTKDTRMSFLIPAMVPLMFKVLVMAKLYLKKAVCTVLGPIVEYPSYNETQDLQQRGTQAHELGSPLERNPGARLRARPFPTENELFNIKVSSYEYDHLGPTTPPRQQGQSSSMASTPRRTSTLTESLPKEAIELPEVPLCIARDQQCTTGKPSNQPQDPDTALHITRSAPDTNMSTLANLKSSLRNRTRAMETLLGRITIPIQNLAQEMECTEYIKRINEMDFESNSNLLDIESEHKNNIEATELATFKASLTT